MSTSLLIQLYEDQVKFLQGQIKVLKEHVAEHPSNEPNGKKNGDGKKKKRALSAYQVFMKERLTASGSDPKASLTLVSKEWNGLDQAEKDRYGTMAKKLNDEKNNAILVESKALSEPHQNKVAQSDLKISMEPLQPQKKDRKRKAPDTTGEAAIAEPPVATASAGKPSVPPTPIAPIPPTPITEDVKSDKKKKKKHHKDGDKKHKNDS